MWDPSFFFLLFSLHILSAVQTFLAVSGLLFVQIHVCQVSYARVEEKYRARSKENPHLKAVSPLFSEKWHQGSPDNLCFIVVWFPPSVNIFILFSFQVTKMIPWQSISRRRKTNKYREKKSPSSSCKTPNGWRSPRWGANIFYITWRSRDGRWGTLKEYKKLAVSLFYSLSDSRITREWYLWQQVIPTFTFFNCG